MAPVSTHAKAKLEGTNPKAAVETKPKAVSVKSPTAAKPSAVVTPQRPPSFKIETVHTKARYFKFLTYGEYGSGKTRLVSTAVGVPEMNDVIMIDAEAGDMTLMDDLQEFAFDDIDTILVKSYKQVAAVQLFLKQHCRLREEIDHGPYAGEDLAGPSATEKIIELEARFKGVEVDDIKIHKMYRTVIIDSLSEVESMCMYQLLGITDVTRLDEEVASAEWAEYKKQNAMIQRLIRGFRDLPMHVLITAASQYSQDEQKRMLYTPSLTGKLSRQVQGFMDVVGYLVTGQAETEKDPLPRRLFVQPTKGSRFSAKCRFSAFKGSSFDNPTMGTILETVGLSAAIASKSKAKGVK